MTSEGEPSQYCCHLQRSLVLSRTMPQRVRLGSRWTDEYLFYRTPCHLCASVGFLFRGWLNPQKANLQNTAVICSTHRLQVTLLYHCCARVPVSVLASSSLAVSVLAVFLITTPVVEAEAELLTFSTLVRHCVSLASIFSILLLPYCNRVSICCCHHVSNTSDVSFKSDRLYLFWSFPLDFARDS